MPDIWKNRSMGDAITAQTVGDEAPGLVLQTLQQVLEEALGGFRIAPFLNQDIQYNTILINSAPEIVLHALDPNEHLVQVPFISWPWPASTQAIGESRAEFLAPASHGFVGDDDAALGQDQLHIAQAETEHVVQPDSVADDRGREPMTGVRVGLWNRVTVSPASMAAAKADYRHNARAQVRLS